MGLGSMYPSDYSHITQNMSEFSPEGMALRAELEKMQSQNAPPGQIMDRINMSMGMVPMIELLTLKQQQQAKSDAPPIGIQAARQTTPSVAQDLGAAPQAANTSPAAAAPSAGPMQKVSQGPMQATSQGPMQQTPQGPMQGIPSLVPKARHRPYPQHQLQVQAPEQASTQTAIQGIPAEELAKIFGKTINAREGGLADLEAHNIGHTDRYAAGGIVAFDGGGLTDAEQAEYNRLHNLALAQVPVQNFSSPMGGFSPAGLKGPMSVEQQAAVNATRERLAELQAKVDAAKKSNEAAAQAKNAQDFASKYGVTLPNKPADQPASTAPAGTSSTNTTTDTNTPHVLADWQSRIGYNPANSGVASLYANMPVYHTSKEAQTLIDKLYGMADKGVPGIDTILDEEVKAARKLGLGSAADREIAELDALRTELGTNKDYLVNKVPERARWKAMGAQASLLGNQAGYAGGGIGGILASYLAGEAGYDTSKQAAIEKYKTDQEGLIKATGLATKAKEEGDWKLLEYAKDLHKNAVTESRNAFRDLTSIITTEERTKGQSAIEAARQQRLGMIQDKDPLVAEQREISALGKFIQLNPNDPNIENYRATYDALKANQQGDLLGTKNAQAERAHYFDLVMKDLDKASEAGGAVSMLVPAIKKQRPNLTDAQALQIAQNQFIEDRMNFYSRIFQGNRGGVSTNTPVSLNAFLKSQGH